MSGITTSVAHMRQWRIAGSHTAIEPTVTAVRGEHVSLDSGIRNGYSMSADVAAAVGQAFQEAAEFVTSSSGEGLGGWSQVQVAEVQQALATLRDQTAHGVVRFSELLDDVLRAAGMSTSSGVDG